MDKTIDIKKGTLSINESGLKIQDDATFNRNLLIISSIFWCVYGGLNILQYSAKENFFYFYFGVFILALWVAVIGFFILKVTFKKELAFSELKKVRIRQDKKGFYLVRALTQKGRIRGFTLSQKKEDAQSIARQLKKKKIEVEWVKE
jgi:hypothetical protein